MTEGGRRKTEDEMPTAGHPSSVSGQGSTATSRSPRTIIQPSKGLLHIDWRGLLEYRDLLVLLVRRDFLAKYKQSVLGPLWFIIQPLATTIVFTVIFGNVAKLPSDGMPKMLFYLCALVPWNYFAVSLQSTATSFTTNMHLFGKVYFPRLIVPLSVVVSNLIAFAIQLLTFLGFFVYFKFFSVAGPLIRPSLELALVPVLLLQVALLSLGFGLLISALTVKYRDLVYAMTFLVQLWMYATPIVYPLSQIPVQWQWVFALNPMTAVIEMFRYAFLGSGAIKPWVLGVSLSMTILILAIGIVLFSRVEKTFMDTI